MEQWLCPKEITMNNKLAIYVLVACLGTGAGAWAHQAEPDPSVKTGDGKAAQAKQSEKSPCSNMQGGVDASGGENVESHAKTDKSKAKATACGKDNGKASAPHAAPTTPNPDVKSRPD
jgi:hypothetical protein